ncbi:serine/threonine-protein kinase [Candidatus Uabimicrobium amorphum]|uniref:non-specific serine/threonine protein kinase n=1 Tax=Uabimicrobium amorphum TaxID=2596890 RepID=A0A5S9IJ72_UABAM|nr:serine/threonine-protein kinase [Candidatus Uabimicrobium amorphum]BBM82848.1 protein kinase [Candidatus Uabimicrobium amorphum]
MQIGNYQILSELGQGSMGRVFLAEDVHKKRKVALKMMLDNQSPLQEKRFLREAQAMSKLSHPNIIKIYEISKDQGYHFFTMRYIEGETLSEWIRNKRLTFNKSVEITTKIAHAMYYAHKNNVLHRDLKAGNIMLNKNGEPIVMDFGLARQIRDRSKLSQTDAILGTPAYMAPEQASGTHNLDQQVDVYGLGVCFYEMLTGRLPFTGTKWQILMKLAKERPPFPRDINPQIPETLERICLKAMEKRKKLRFATALEFAEELERYSQGKASLIKKRVGTSMMLWAQKHAVPVMGSLVVFLGIICGLLFYELYFSKQEQVCEIEVPSSVADNEGFVTIKGKVNRGYAFQKLFINGKEYKVQHHDVFEQKVALGYKKNSFEIVVLTHDNRWSKFSVEVVRAQPGSRSAFFLGSPQRNSRVVKDFTQDLKDKWKFTAKDFIASSPVISDGIVFFGCDDTRLYAVKTQSGELCWTFKTITEVRATPAVKDGYVYFGGEDIFYCLDMYNSQEKWRFVTGEKSWSSPAIDSKHVYFGCDNGKFFALDKSSGQEKWKVDIIKEERERRDKKLPAINPLAQNIGIQQGFTSPVLFEDSVIVTCNNGSIYSFDRDTGKKNWMEIIGAKIESSPVLHEGVVYFGCQRKFVQRPRDFKRYIYAMDAKTGKIQWRHRMDWDVDSSPLIYNEVLYATCDDNKIHIVKNLKSGKPSAKSIPLISGRSKEKHDYGVFSSPVIAGNYLYCCDYNGILYVVDTKKRRQVAKYDKKKKTYSTPVIYDGDLFFASGDTFYAMTSK